MKLSYVKQGESITASFGLTDDNGVKQPLDGYTCLMQLRNAETKLIAAGVDRVITQKDESGLNFIGVVTAVEASQLIVGDEFVLAAELTHEQDATGIETDPIHLSIENQWVY